MLFIFKKSCCVLCSVSSNFLLMANSLNIYIFPYYGMTTHSFVCDACIHHALLISCDITQVALVIRCALPVDFSLFSQIVGDVPCIEKHLVVWRFQFCSVLAKQGCFQPILFYSVLDGQPVFSEHLKGCFFNIYVNQCSGYIKKIKKLVSNLLL